MQCKTIDGKIIPNLYAVGRAYITIPAHLIVFGPAERQQNISLSK